ncbi:protein-glutamate O-methyltransferase CheR [Lamprobacter modestohalophilus]|uniref:CheR family methyltransferase n=1 Tax=Lamprobacter modestohalophilus TaxID=1064514 RepID=UPI002ADEE1ED|nr:protein-glutamate O-methyltransferase CheR [Lamprobacter modestohalophilus]MEA1048532.1 protein-glutamate O-methyltransferase CheR [Lamprobacter modestohalophilus]
MTEQLAVAKRLIHERLGLRFEGLRERQLRRALTQRLQATASASPAAYLELLRRSAAEMDALASLVTINETFFDREPHHLQLLADHLLPSLLAARKGAEPIGILSLGCSSGEEPYSLAMTVQERWGRQAATLMRITGADLDSTRIAHARAGCYHTHALRELSAQRRQQWFLAQDAHHYCLQPRIRQAVRFQVVNVLDAQLPSLLGQQDLVFYRNISIYFDIPTRTKVLQNIKRLLRPGGFLVVGTTEVLSNDLGVFRLVEQKGCWYFVNAPPAA